MVRSRGRPKGPRGPAAIVSAEQVRRVLRGLGGTRHADRSEIALLLSIEAGLRGSELAALRFSDVYDEKGQVRASIAVSWRGSVRHVPLRSKLLRSRLAD